MYILPTPTHLEVVALGDSSDISPDQHLNYASDCGSAACLAAGGGIGPVMRHRWAWAPKASLVSSAAAQRFGSPGLRVRV